MGIRLVIAAALVALAACSDGGGEGGEGGGPGGPGPGGGSCEVPQPTACDGLAPVPPEDYCRARGRALCAAGRRCYYNSEEETARCLEDVERACAEDVFGATVAAGSIAYDAEAAACCLLRVERDLVCRQAHRFLLDEPACAAAAAGQLAAGEPCSLWAECSSGYCEREGGCPGVCVADQAEGEVCAFAASICAGKLSCVYDDASRDSVCRPPLREGQECLDDEECELGLTCRERYAEGWVCSRPGCVGEACGEERGLPECEVLIHVCDEGTGRCVPLPGAGGSCMNDLQCAAGFLCQGNDPWTRTRGSCVPAPAEGEPCLAAEETEYFGCSLFMTCLPSRVCAFAPLLGETCEPGGPACTEGYCAADGVCRPFRAPGADCTDDRPSCEGACQADGTCGPAPGRCPPL